MSGSNVGSDLGRLGPFDDFDDAARAVYGALAGTEAASVGDLLARLLATLRSLDLRIDAERERADEAESRSLADRLTGLANHGSWIAALALEEDRCRRHGSQAAVVVIDLDELRDVNDADGRDTGDELLKRAARVLVRTTRAHDLAARTGGDEFALLAVGCDAGSVGAVRKRIMEGMDADGVVASVGAAARDEGRDLYRAWLDADNAMHAAKRSGGVG